MKTISNLMILLITSMLFTSCAMFNRRDFEDQMDEFYANEDPMFLPNQDFHVMSGDSGRASRTNEQIRRRTPATIKEQKAFKYQNSLTSELIRLENRLSEEEYNQYIGYRDQLGNESEKIYFLRLNGNERSEYLGLRGIENSKYYTVRETQLAAHNSEIVMGMNKSSVISSWGEPMQRDFAGDPRYQNERWAYRKGGKTKFIYFEGGKVGGWADL